MRGALATLLVLSILVHAAFPAAPGYVCMGMGGAHRMEPCCIEPTPPSQPAWSSRCCEPAPPRALDTSSRPPEPAPTLADAATLPAGAPVLLPLPMLRSADTPLPRSGAPPGSARPLYVLRI